MRIEGLVCLGGIISSDLEENKARLFRKRDEKSHSYVIVPRKQNRLLLLNE
jgi:hypothetical protein